MFVTYTIYFSERINFKTIGTSFRDVREFVENHETGAFDGLTIKCIRKHAA